MTRGGLALVAFLALLVGTATARAGDDVARAKAMRGISTLGVSVDELPPDLVSAGLTAEEIRSAVATKLRSVGVTVSDDAPVHAPYVYVNVTGLLAHTQGSPRTGFTASIDLELRQAVVLAHDASIATVATTWSTGGLYGSGDARAIKSGVAQLADELARAYLAANPPEAR